MPGQGVLRSGFFLFLLHVVDDLVGIEFHNGLGLDVFEGLLFLWAGGLQVPLAGLDAAGVWHG